MPRGIRSLTMTPTTPDRFADDARATFFSVCSGSDHRGDAALRIARIARPPAGAMRRALAAALGAASIATMAVAADEVGDPLPAPACRRAVEALATREDAIPAAPPAGAAADAGARPRVDPALAALRRDAATACLTRRADPTLSSPPLARPPPVAFAPLAVAPASAPAPVAGPRAAAPGTPPRTPERPYAIMSCDAGGCWANDGTRLNRIGPELRGPRGACTVQGTLLQCP